jgi:hypothetical protein
MTAQRIANCVCIVVLMAGCATGTTTQSPDAAAVPAARLDMTGRWTLSAPNAPSCGISFEAAAGAQAGAVRPEGGCPGDFFRSRRWSLAQGSLTITDHKSEPLAELKASGERFVGQSIGGMPVTLARAAPLQ